MNTSKQINVMIGLLFVLFVVTGVYLFNESSRQEREGEEISERNAERGARLFVRNCRGCHGLEGEGGIGPVLNNPAFLVLGEGNAYDVDQTPQGEAAVIETYLRETISCGRAGTFMPKWAITFGGSLSDTQVEQLVALITNDPTGKTDFWELVVAEGEEADEEQFAGVLERRFAVTEALTQQLGREPTPEEVEAFVLPKDPADLTDFIEEFGREPSTAEIRAESAAKTPISDASTLTITQNTCGQFTNDLKLERRGRPDPRVAAAATPTPDGDGATATATVTPAGPSPARGQELSVGLGCVGCHTVDGSTLVGPTWLGLFGRTEQLADGSTVVVDEAYLRESMVDPNAKVVEGFPAIMPSFASLSDDDIAALIAYIQTLEE